MAVEGTDPRREHLVETEGADVPEPVDVGIEEGLSAGDDGVVDSVPVTSELGCHLVHAPGPSADLNGHPLGGPRKEELTRGGDEIVFFVPRVPGAGDFHTDPPALLPDQPARSSMAGQVDKLDGRPVLHSGHHTARRKGRPVGLRLDMQTDR
jgi:hypothetical protein